MKLDEAMKKANSSGLEIFPEMANSYDIRDKCGDIIATLEPGQGTPDDLIGINAALLAHWYNVGPKLLEALRQSDIEAKLYRIQLGFEEESSSGMDRRRNIIAEAEEVKGI